MAFSFTLFQQAEKERQRLFPQLIWHKLLFSPGSQDSRWEVVNTVSTMLKMNADLECDNLAELFKLLSASTYESTQSTSEKKETFSNFLIDFVGLDGFLPRNERQKGLIAVSEVQTFLF